jgi:hypothetical protein
MVRSEERIYAQVCALCGKELNPVEQVALKSENLPGACEEHYDQVLAQIVENGNRWPADWAGRSWEDPNGLWHYE